MADNGVSVGKVTCGVVLGLVIFFFVLPLAMCGGCATCAGVGMMETEMERQKIEEAKRLFAPPPAQPVRVKSGPSDTGYTGVVDITTKPAGAKVLVDGRDTGATTPVQIRVPTGEHSIGVRLDGHRVESRSVIVNSDVTTKQTINMRKLP